jgi:hypothetical protein
MQPAEIAYGLFAKRRLGSPWPQLDLRDAGQTSLNEKCPTKTY